MLHIRPVWIFISLAAVAAVAFWNKSPSDLLDNTLAKATNFPQAYMTDIEIREHDLSGKLRNTLITRSAEYYQFDSKGPSSADYTLLEQPNLVVTGAGSAPWVVTADQGRIDQNGQRVTLTDNVRAAQQSAEQGLIELLTSELRIKTAEQYAETDKAVKMRAQQGHLDTIGMKAFLSEDRIELLSQVRGTYEPR